MNRYEGRRDLSPLDPAADPERWEAMIRGINRAAAPEIARRRALPEPGVLLFLADWRRPAAAVCTAIAAGAAAILLVQPARSADTDTGMAQALGYPDPVASWVETGVSPSVEELVFSLEGTE